MIAKRTTFANTGNTLAALEAAITTARKDGAQDDAAIWFFPQGDGYTLKAEWEFVEPDPAGPPADTREQPTTVDEAKVAVIGDTLKDVQPDGLVNETPAH